MQVHHVFKVLSFQGWYICHFENNTPSISTIQSILMMPCKMGLIIFLHNNMKNIHMFQPFSQLHNILKVKDENS
jgi:hypothetical protein